MKNAEIEYIKKQYGLMHQLNHASNIITKLETASAKEREALTAIVPNYYKYLKTMLETTGYDQKSIIKKVKCVNAYFNFIHDQGFDNTFSAQGKFRPTILEEFLFLLFKDYVADVKKKFDTDNTLTSGNVKAYSNLYFKAKNFQDFIQKPEIGINHKDQDFAIYRTFTLVVNGGNEELIQIPAVAIEAKTYIDKTMLDSIIATAEKIKSGNPHTRFIAVAERYDVSFAVDPAYSRIDQIYVLRKGVRKREWADIDPNVVWKMFSETINHLEKPWSDVETRLTNDGVIL